MGAEIALPRLASDFASQEAASAWHPVAFQGSRGIHAALRGERLSPSDVDACPPLSEVGLVTEALCVDRAVVINGPTGSGKSITSYQALHRLTKDGFEVLRLRDDARNWGVERWFTDLRLFPWPKVLFVDDAQDLSPDTVRELAERANADTRVLVAGIDQVAGGVRTLKISAGAAVAQLAHWVREQREVVFPLVAELDDHVGSHSKDFFFDKRIDVASKERTPWLFFHALTGGWRRIYRAALEMRDLERADLALLLVAVVQIAGADAGASHQRLLAFAQQLDKDEAWLARSLTTLKSRRLVIETDGRLRCGHLQNAFAMLAWMLHPPPLDDAAPPVRSTNPVPPIASASQDSRPTPLLLHAKSSDERPRLADADAHADRELASKIVTFALESEETPLRGLSWLADCGPFFGARDVLRWQRVLDVSRYQSLARRALLTPSSGDVAAAAQLLAESISHCCDIGILEIVRENDDRLSEWFSAVAPENAWALGDLVNSLYQLDRELAAHLAAHADPQRLARLVIDGGWAHSASTGHALDRLCNVGGAAVRDAIRCYLDRDNYAEMFDVGTEFWRATALLADLIYLDHELALFLLNRVAPRLANQFVDDPVRRWNEMFDLAIHLGFGPFGPPGRRPPREVLKAVKAFTKALDQERLAAALSGPNDLWGQLNFDRCIAFLLDADPKVFASIVTKVDMVAFEESLRRTAHDPDKTALIIASALQDFRPTEVHDILDRLEPDLQHLDLCFAYIAPDVALRAVRRGLPLDLELSGQQHWKTAAEVLDRIREHDGAIAGEVAAANAEAMAIGLAAENASDPWADLRYWIKACDLVAPHLIDEVIEQLPKGAVLSWQRGLKRPGVYQQSRRRDIAPLVQRATRLSGYVEAEAKQLVRRYPSLASQVETSQA
ncbi:hypothetical protein [Mycobacterium sp. SMC-11]|uniref:hypothetical protein n=1 Tax=Mycobacterium sp. SMC-11 TaxID=3385969 RepID=UPI00390CC46B